MSYSSKGRVLVVFLLLVYILSKSIFYLSGWDGQRACLLSYFGSVATLCENPSYYRFELISIAFGVLVFPAYVFFLWRSGSRKQPLRNRVSSFGLKRYAAHVFLQVVLIFWVVMSLGTDLCVDAWGGGTGLGFHWSCIFPAYVYMYILNEYYF